MCVNCVSLCVGDIYNNVTSTCSHQRAPPVLHKLLQPLGTNLGEVMFGRSCKKCVMFPLVLGDDSLWYWSDPCLCLEVKCDEVFSIIAKLSITINLISLVVPLTAVHGLENVDT